MNHQDFLESNKTVLKTLKDFSEITQIYSNVIILGSICTISHAQEIGYFRQIKDIDAIVDSKYRNEIETNLRKRGYEKSTFIDKKMPFSKVLRRFSSTRYVRFHKDNSCDLEILFSPFIFEKSSLKVELFPFFFAKLPKDAFVTKTLEDIKIKTISPEAKYGVQSLTHNSFGRLYKKGYEKRIQDREALRKCIDVGKYENTMKNFRIYLGPFSFPIRRFIKL